MYLLWKPNSSVSEIVLFDIFFNSLPINNYRVSFCFQNTYLQVTVHFWIFFAGHGERHSWESVQGGFNFTSKIWPLPKVSAFHTTGDGSRRDNCRDPVAPSLRQYADRGGQVSRQISSRLAHLNDGDNCGLCVDEERFGLRENIGRGRSWINF